ncbi:transposase [Streptomyces olivochromogenes]|uniref:transposase n=1 Tax=Streptomyces olivochromogenes TaxID=1963 RepID=UPI0035B3AE9C|nr:transposase [Streptomyces olivochromogenes]
MGFVAHPLLRPEVVDTERQEVAAQGRSPPSTPPALSASARFRAEQATTAWKKRYARRADVEGTFAQASRQCNIHHTRYRGQARTHVGHALTAMALNIVRVAAWLNEARFQESWISRLTRFKASLSVTGP